MDNEDPVRLPIDGVLDLHTFQPKEVKDLLPAYIEECLSLGIFQIRIIHGKGIGVLRKTVRGLLEKNPRVASFKDADLGGGGWGATEVLLFPEKGPVPHPSEIKKAGKS